MDTLASLGELLITVLLRVSCLVAVAVVAYLIFNPIVEYKIRHMDPELRRRRPLGTPPPADEDPHAYLDPGLPPAPPDDAAKAPPTTRE